MCLLIMGHYSAKKIGCCDFTYLKKVFIKLNETFSSKGSGLPSNIEFVSVGATLALPQCHLVGMKIFEMMITNGFTLHALQRSVRMSFCSGARVLLAYGALGPDF